MKTKSVVIIFFIVSFIIGMNQFLAGKSETQKIVIQKKKFHSETLMKEFHEHLYRFQLDTGQRFLIASKCIGCHGYDSMQLANINAQGVDINLYNDWETSMMGLSARDPFWRAKVSHELLIDPAHSIELQNKCTSCHAPMGHFNYMYHGGSSYTMSYLVNDSLGLDGVSCGGCHEIGTNGLGARFSGDIPYDTTFKLFGPFQNPEIGPMQLYTGFIPTYSTHMDQSKLCSPCHTLQTNSVDLAGNLTGHSFTEQATYHEWENSLYPDDNIVCQRCHMPQLTDSIIIVNQHLNGTPRFPFNQHKFMGGNSLMVNLIKQNKIALGVVAPDASFDSTLSATLNNLNYHTLNVDLSLDSMTLDTAYLNVRLINQAGHKFPSGYPSRRAVVQLVVFNQNMDTIFKSGIFDGNFEVADGFPTAFQPHYNIINQQNQTQIYQMIMGDVNADITTVLERGDTCLKDNRIPPEGFSTSFYNYDTVKIVGEASADADFNRYPNGAEGGGRDNVHYHIPISGLTENLSAIVNVWYQSVPKGWLTEMFAISSPEIDTFKSMYLNADQSPVLVGTDFISSIPAHLLTLNNPIEIKIIPTITLDGKINISIIGNDEIRKINVFDINGKLVSSFLAGSLTKNLPVKLPDEAGTYFLEIYLSNREEVRKVIKE